MQLCKQMLTPLSVWRMMQVKQGLDMPAVHRNMSYVHQYRLAD